MKKLLYLFFAFSLMGCGDNQTEEEDCGCVKTSYHRYYRTTISNSGVMVVVGIENVPCQDQESQVTTSQVKSETWWYKICCNNIDTPFYWL
jgi:hypothetical protein